jgi:hypothetical protein
MTFVKMKKLTQQYLNESGREAAERNCTADNRAEVGREFTAQNLNIISD